MYDMRGVNNFTQNRKKTIFPVSACLKVKVPPYVPNNLKVVLSYSYQKKKPPTLIEHFIFDKNLLKLIITSYGCFRWFILLNEGHFFFLLFL